MNKRDIDFLAALGSGLDITLLVAARESHCKPHQNQDDADFAQHRYGIENRLVRFRAHDLRREAHTQNPHQHSRRPRHCIEDHIVEQILGLMRTRREPLNNPPHDCARDQS